MQQMISGPYEIFAQGHSPSISEAYARCCIFAIEPKVDPQKTNLSSHKLWKATCSRLENVPKVFCMPSNVVGPTVGIFSTKAADHSDLH